MKKSSSVWKEIFLGILNDRNNYDKISETFRLIGRLKKSKLL